MKKIKLTKNKFTIVDDQDFEWLNQWKWKYSKTGYVVRNQWLPKEKKYLAIYMHRLINQTPKGMFTDHINRSSLDNRRNNLRTCTNSQNQMNRDIQKNNTSGFKGIYWDRERNKWSVWIVVKNKRIRLGRYSNFQGAWLARRFGERIYFRDFIAN